MEENGPCRGGGERHRVWWQKQGHQEHRSFVLRTYVAGGMGVRELHIDWWVQVVPASPGECDYANVDTSGGLFPRILILLQTTFIHLVVTQLHDRRQLVKVGAVTQSYLWALSVSSRDPLVKQIVTRGRQLTKAVLWAFSSGTVDPILFPFPGFGMNTQFLSLSFPGSGNDT